MAHLAADLLWIGLAIEQVIFLDPSLLNKTFEQILAEARRMLNGQADIFIEVKHLDLRPGHTRGFGECLKEFKLRSSGGSNDSRTALLCNSLADGAGGL